MLGDPLKKPKSKKSKKIFSSNAILPEEKIFQSIKNDQ
jgi:hypothetical protein